MPKIGITARKISEISWLMRKDITMAKISMAGQRIRVRMIIIKAFCTLLTSVVKRVTSPALLNLSILENEYTCR